MGRDERGDGRISWRTWSGEAFEEARRRDAPVLLAIGAPWCHWCHVMDERSYSDPDVVRIVQDRFVPVRVDADRRPDVDARYNLGGWPTTAVLNPEGRLLTGATYVPAGALRDWLSRVADSYSGGAVPEGIDSVAAEAGDVTRSEVSWEVYDEVLDILQAAYDEVHGGFGKQMKFLFPEALELWAQAARLEGPEDAPEKLRHTLDRMIEGGIRDEVEGGFFRYATSRDWSSPHYEKLLSDNAAMLVALLHAHGATGESRYLAVAGEVVRYLDSVLWLGEPSGWAGSQDADQDYYSLDARGRSQREAPRIDRTFYVDRNAHAASAMLQAGPVLRRTELVDRALSAVDTILGDAVRASQDGIQAAHYFEGDGPGEGWGFLGDQSALGEALARAYEASGDRGWLDGCRELAMHCLAELRDPRGVFYDRPEDPREPGAVGRPRFDLVLNARAARWLSRLSALTGDESFSEAAQAALAAVGGARRGYGPASAVYALAVAEAMLPWAVVGVSGEAAPAGGGAGLHRAALAAGLPAVAVNPLGPGPEGDGRSKAYVCIEARCLEPAEEPEALSESLRAARASGRRAH